MGRVPTQLHASHPRPGGKEPTTSGCAPGNRNGTYRRCPHTGDTFPLTVTMRGTSVSEAYKVVKHECNNNVMELRAAIRLRSRFKHHDLEVCVEGLRWGGGGGGLFEATRLCALRAPRPGHV